MSALSRLRLFRLNPAEDTATGWIKVLAAYVIIGPVVGAVVAAFVFSSINIDTLPKSWGDPPLVRPLPITYVTSLLVFTFTFIVAAHHTSALLAAATALAVLLLSHWMKRSTTTLVLLVPVFMVGLFYVLQSAFGISLIGAWVVMPIQMQGLVNAVPILAAAVAASLVSWRLATGRVREAVQ